MVVQSRSHSRRAETHAGSVIAHWGWDRKSSALYVGKSYAGPESTGAMRNRRSHRGSRCGVCAGATAPHGKACGWRRRRRMPSEEMSAPAGSSSTSAGSASTPKSDASSAATGCASHPMAGHGSVRRYELCSASVRSWGTSTTSSLLPLERRLRYAPASAGPTAAHAGHHPAEKKSPITSAPSSIWAGVPGIPEGGCSTSPNRWARGGRRRCASAGDRTRGGGSRREAGRAWREERRWASPEIFASTHCICCVVSSPAPPSLEAL
mmetsp:Transcript_17158/g.56025  ORF Transcript_17158/g.56025 Transcript_17158/m.56025 type:complete len:265 (+) Transcript_17158:864-1658(+)